MNYIFYKFVHTWVINIFAAFFYFFIENHLYNFRYYFLN